MTKMKWFRWTWADGTVTICRGYSKTEKTVMERNHGRLISKVLEI